MVIHSLIADLAWQSLSPAKQAELNKITDIAYQRLAWQHRQQLEFLYPNSPQLVKLAGEPDRWRHKPLSKIYSSFQATLPSALMPMANHPIDHWHYTNLPLPNRSCTLPSADNILTTIPTLILLLQHPSDENARAVQLVLLIHLIADLHQPLHVYSHTNKKCVNDHGGNTFCLKSKRHQKCRFNLHQFWDSGCGLLTRAQDLPAVEQSIKNRVTVFNPEQASTLSDWVYAEKPIAEFAYHTRHGRIPTKVYIQQCQAYSAQQILLAAQRLATILNALP